MRTMLALAVLVLTLSTAGCGWHHHRHHNQGCNKAHVCAKCPCPGAAQSATPAQ